jgi:hypothetical protein
MSRKPSPLRDFFVGFLLTSVSWALWAARTQALVGGCWWGVGLLAGAEEAVTLGAVCWVCFSKTYAGAAGCVLGAALGSGLASLLFS